MRRWNPGWWTAAALAACAGGDDDKAPPIDHTGDTETLVTVDDADGDGSPTDEDCDDADPWVRPGIPERCDGIDTDCDPSTVDPPNTAGRSDGGNHATIGEAVAEAGPGATIWVCEGTFPESVTIDKDLTVRGLGAVVVDASGLGAGFDVVGASATLEDLTIVGGTGSPNGPAPENGGGVNAASAVGPVTLRRVVIEGCVAELGGGVAFGVDGGSIEDSVVRGNLAGTHGGGIYVFTEAQVVRTAVEANTANGYGGGVGLAESASAWIVDAQLDGNDASLGGGLFAFAGGSVDLTGTTVTDNAAVNGGGGLYLWDGAVVGGEVSGNQSAQGGGVFLYAGGALEDVMVARNAASDGGGVWIDGPAELTAVTIEGNTATDSGGGGYLLDAAVEAVDTTISENEATLRGGGLLLVDSAVVGGTISENVANDGGGVYVSSAGEQLSQLEGTAITDNTALNSGAGLFAAGSWNLTDVDVSRNVSADRGGGLYATFGATGTMTGGAVFGNAAAARGGGVYPNGGSLLVFDGTSITRNVALRGAGFYVNDGSTVTLIGAVVSQNGDPDPTTGTVTGGGARVTLGTLVSTDTDWGEGPLDNVPDDVFVEATQLDYAGYGAHATFTCDESACTPAP